MQRQPVAHILPLQPSQIMRHGCKKADLVIIDDPVKGFAEAHSPTTRKAIWEWFLSELYTRLSAHAVVIIIMTRWHVDDLVGRLLDPARQEQIDGGTLVAQFFRSLL